MGNEKKFDLEDFIPEPKFMRHAWAGCLSWAIGEPAIMEHFRQDRPDVIIPKSGGLEGMIDKAAGVDRVCVEAFILWFNENIWGNDPMELEGIIIGPISPAEPSSSGDTAPTQPGADVGRTPGETGTYAGPPLFTGEEPEEPM